MTVDRRSTYHHGNLKEALIEAGVRLLAQEGSATLSLRGVAREAHVSHNAPYAHFADKEELLSAIAEEGFLELAAAMDQVLANTAAGTVEQVRDLGMVYVQFAVTHPQHYQLMFADLALTIHGTLSDTAYGTFARLQQAIAAAQQDQQMTSGDSKLLAMSVWTTVHGLATLVIKGRTASMTGDMGDTELTEILLDQLFNGLAAN
ncbi:MAG: TetR/AcrR family transcriptional regulator [Caldilineaceae bacterium]|nr:TetR/AcrR family transcriptional regulator [Caldilineaceae bacterium]